MDPLTAASERPLLGRETIVAGLRKWLVTARAEGASLCLSGTAGCGKTALLDVAAAAARRQGWTVLRTAGIEFQADISLAALDSLFAPVRALIESLAEHDATALSVAMGLADGHAPTELALCNAVLSLIRRAAKEQPLILVVDDAHWLDAASKMSLTFAARRLAGSSIGVLMALRPGVDGVVESARLPTVPVDPLDDATSAHLLHARYPNLSPRVAQRVLVEAAGNPLALEEVPISLSPAQQIGHEDLPVVLPVGARLSAVFAPRVAALPPELRQVLLRMALDDDPSRRLVSGVDAKLADVAIAAAARAGILTANDPGSGLPFRHPLARAAVVEAASELERRRAHRFLAQQCEPGSAKQTWHLAAATVSPDEAIAAALEGVSRQNLRRGASRGAMVAMVRAAELSPDSVKRAHRYLNAATIAADVTGDLAAASQMLLAARDSDESLATSLDAAVAAAHIGYNGEGDVDGAHRLLVHAVEQHLDPTDPSDPTLIDALHSLIMLSWWSGKAKLWRPVDTALARLQPAPPLLLDFCANTFSDPVRRAAEVVPSATGLIANLPFERNPLEITRTAIGCVYIDRIGDCREALWRLIRDGRTGGAVALAINAMISTCSDDWFTGRWDEALDIAAEGEHLCQLYGYRRYSLVIRDYYPSLVNAARGEILQCTAAGNALLRAGATEGSRTAEQFGHHILATAALAQGRFDEAYYHAAEVSPAGQFLPYTPHALWLALDLVEAAVRSGRPEPARAHAAAMQAAGLPAISSRLALVTLGSTAMTADNDTAGDCFQEALHSPDADLWPFELARITLAYGEFMRSQRLFTEAQVQFEQALQLFDSLGSRPWRARAASNLRSVGLSSLSSSNARATVTAHQWRVAELAASGLTNRQIAERLAVSHRTVGATLYQLFPKLGVTSRAALRAALDAHEAEPLNELLS